MFKLYQIRNHKREELIPENDIYTVYELGNYEFHYQSDDIVDRDNIDIFVEDLFIDKTHYEIHGDTIKSYQNQFFQDYFGFATLKINNEVFNVNILIEKFKLSEIEEILLFLWESENKIFDNFFSKSTLKTSISNVGSDFGLTSKYLTFSEVFCNTFTNLYYNFKNLPRSFLRSKIESVHFSHDKVSAHSLDWIINNLDYICFDQNFEGHPDAIVISNKYGLIEKIETESKISSYAVYENEIILGAFKNIINQLRQLQKQISLNLDINNAEVDKNYADFRDLKKIPYIKLFRDSNNIEAKLSGLYNKYKIIFNGAMARCEKPRVTNTFANSPHYNLAYKLIRDSFDYKFNFSGELNMLNIKKLSQLYEAYNLHQIILAFKEKLILDPYFTFETSSNREDGIIDYIRFSHDIYTIEIFYELKIPNENTQHIRLDNNGGGTYYLPDYIINIKSHDEIMHSAILDSKYSKYYTLKNNHLPLCISKYIINLGFKDSRYRKIDDLILLYPGEYPDSIQSNPNYAPRIILLPSKPKFENFIKEYVGKMIDNYLPSYTFKTEQNKSNKMQIHLT